jgi:hypothetical protein
VAPTVVNTPVLSEIYLPPPGDGCHSPNLKVLQQLGETLPLTVHWPEKEKTASAGIGFSKGFAQPPARNPLIRKKI